MNKFEQLSEHFSLAEATASLTAQQLAIDNTPNEYQLLAMVYTANKLELVRSALGSVPLRVNSWFRCARLNAAVGGSATSGHLLGNAVDFTIATYSPMRVCRALANIRNELRYDQLILEPTWTHISFTASTPRLQELTWHNRKYLPGLVDLRNLRN